LGSFFCVLGHEVAAGARLVLTNVDYTHRGKYECTAKGAWDDHTSFTLDVQGGCPVEFAKDVSLCVKFRRL